MKNLMIAIAVLALSLNSFAGTAKKTKKATIDVAASSVIWTGKKIGGSHTGKVSIKKGEVEYKNNKFVKGFVSIDLTTITNDDLKDPTYNQKIVSHLKSEDFFNVEKFPLAFFKINSVSELHNFVPGQPNLDVSGMMTIRGVTKPFETKLFYTPSKTGFVVKGKLIIERTQFGLKFNAKSFLSADKLKEIGDKLIDDNFEVDLNLVAKK